VLIGKINEPKLKNFQFIDMYIIIACPEMSIVNFKKWNIHVVTPHEALMALDPDNYPWDS
jgi:diphthamide biosynthesis protein 2